MAPKLRRLHTSNPQGATIAVMGRTATQAADTWTMREWAARLATRAGPRDYVGQLRELYNGILKRWRYVMEPGEWVHGNANTLLEYTLGAKYNRGPDCPTAKRCDVLKTKWRERGWGDCDDVAELVAAGAIALGMTPAFRVVRWKNGAHVSVVVRTPKGQLVSVDPVGHPTNEFGWALDPHGARVGLFDMTGRPLRGRPSNGPLGALEEGATMHEPTYMSGPEGLRARAPGTTHYVITRPGDTRGARTLGMPLWNYRLAKRGMVMDGMPAMDEYGDQYEYNQGADLWVPMGRKRRRFFKKFAKRLKKRLKKRVKKHLKRLTFAKTRKRLRRVLKKTKTGRKILKAGKRVRKGVAKVGARIGKSKIVRFFQKAKAKILSSPLVQRIAATALSAFGVPPAATRAALAREAKMAKMGGRLKLVTLLAAGKKKEAAQFMKKSFKAAAKGAIPIAIRRNIARARRLKKRFSGPDEVDTGYEYELGQGDEWYNVAPVEVLEGMAGVVELGQVNAQDTVVPGTFYAIKKGDTLLGIGQRLNAGQRTGGPLGSRQKAAQLINSANYNRRFQRATKEGFERNVFGTHVIQLNPRFATDQALAPYTSASASGHQYAALWIPPAIGVEPPEICPPGSRFDEGTGTCVTLPQPEPDDPEEEPVVVVEEEGEEPVVVVAPEEPVPAPPVGPPVEPAAPLPGEDMDPGDFLTDPADSPLRPPASVTCPEWFFESPTSPGTCRPVTAPGGPGCPEGHYWDPEMGDLGGCRRDYTTDDPAKPSDFDPEPEPGCPPGTVASGRGGCVKEPTGPYRCPPGTTQHPTTGQCIPIAPGPFVPPPTRPGPGPAPPSADRGAGAFPFIAILGLLLAGS